MKKELNDKLQSKKEQRVKDARRNIFNSIIIASSVIYTSILQEQREQSVEIILEKQVSSSSKEFKKVALEAEYNISQLLKDLNEKEEALSKLSLTIPANEQSLMRDVSALSVKLVDLESDLKKFESLNLDIKMAAIEESIEGSPQSILSIPLIKNDLENYKLLSDKEFLRIEKVLSD
ncbi:hypothetical protein [Photobacterium leiognathi]|uniref:Uncharacterized protein n=1 Tax=Photobacterium leiognathi TaxID=553611 RepID=A0A2T3MGS2_PHOLE|nr:hypothetical protein [Photobacterium leiognathi]KJF98646.1 hypothetical protein UB34_06410 [Photobacterium leiognathi]PSV93374.1 hypothetical protein CTM89_02845 [Photobacterium leiognathi]